MASRLFGEHLRSIAYWHCNALTKERNETKDTLLIFDQKTEEQGPLTALLSAPPEWTDEYYSRRTKQARLCQIVDAPYFADSTTVALIQVADFLAYFLRRHAEIADGLVQARYEDEQTKVGAWIEKIGSRCIGSAHIYPAKNRCDAANQFWELCPESLLKL